MDYNEKTIRFLVTGGAGFIGSNIVAKLLEQGYFVRVVDNYITGNKDNLKEFFNHPQLQIIDGDITDINVCMNACKDIDYVLHQAALGSVPRSIKDPIATNNSNVTGFLNMLFAAKENKVKRFVYASSSSVYGDSTMLPKIEGLEGNPLSPYALTKKIDEMYAKMFNSIYGLPTIGLRYFNVYGPKQDPNSVYAAVIPLFINNLINNKRVAINGDGSNSRDFTFVDDVVNANINACLIDDNNYAVYNIAYGQRTTIDELYQKMKKILNSNLDPIYVAERQGDVKHSHASIKKAHKYINYRPQYNIDKGLEKTIKWYLMKKN